MTGQPTVYLFDADVASCEAMASVVQSQGLAVCKFTTPAELLSEFRGDPPGCLVAEISASGLTYADLRRHLEEQGSRLPVIALATHADVPLAVAVLRQGAQTLLHKPCPPGEPWRSIAEALAQDAQLRQHNDEREAIRQNYATLNDAERSVLSLLVAGHANKMIAAQLKIGLRTVEMRRAAVLKKMHAGSVAEVVRMAIEIGIE